MARCLGCGEKVCTRETNFYPEFGGFICPICERNEEFMQRKKQEVEYLLNQNN